MIYNQKIISMSKSGYQMLIKRVPESLILKFGGSDTTICVRDGSIQKSSSITVLTTCFRCNTNTVGLRDGNNGIGAYYFHQYLYGHIKWLQDRRRAKKVCSYSFLDGRTNSLKTTSIIITIICITILIAAN